MELTNETVAFENEEQLQKVRKKKQRNKIVIGVIVASVIVIVGALFLLFRNLLSERDPISLEAFTHVLEENDFEIYDLGYRFQEGPGSDAVVVYFGATDGSTEFEFLELVNVQEARNLFENIRSGWEHGRGSSSSQSFVSGVNFDVYRLTTGGLYREILRVEHIVIIGVGEQANRGNIQDLFSDFENHD